MNNPYQLAVKTYMPHLQQVSAAPKKKKKDEGIRNALKVRR
jgi:hypothetical protein